VFTRGYKAFIELVREVEQILVKNKIEGTTEHIHILRGLYYGTTWSVDFEDRKSTGRNFFFNTYSYSSEPPDPRSMLGLTLFNEMRQCAEVYESPTDRFDFGHCIIGLDCRNSYRETMPYPDMEEGPASKYAHGWVILVVGQACSL
jgi:hypothetical protein